MLKAIDTVYNGNKFRSRLEARWAVFFNALNIKYSYEPEGFDLNGDWYLPDFFIPAWNCWIEIKPEKPIFYDNSLQTNIEKKEYRRCQYLAKESKKAVMLIGGDPWIDKTNYEETGNYEHEYRIAIFSSNYVVQGKNKTTEDEVVLNIPFFNEFTLNLDKLFYESDSALYGHLIKNFKEHPNYFINTIPDKGDTHNLIESDKEYYRRKFGRENPGWYYDIAENNFLFNIKNNELGLSIYAKYEKPNDVLINAFTKARQERF